MSSPTINPEQIERRCPVCDAAGHEKCLQKGDLRLVRCAQCGMIFASPVPVAYVNGAFYEDAGRPFYLSAEKLEGDYAPVRFERELRMFRRVCARGKVLDVGCSTGAFLYQLGQRFPGGYEGFGTDVSGPALDYAESKGIKVIRKDFLADDFPGSEFDAITMWAVLEHVSEPKAFLAQAAGLLKRGGVCLALVPNWKSLARRVLNERYRYILGQHLNYFSEESLRRMAEDQFEVLEAKFTHFNPVVIREDLRRRGLEPSGTERARLLQRTNRLKRRRILRFAYGIVEGALSTGRLADNLTLVLRKR